jgi:DNA-binding transcriptional LysR family regulator
VRTSGLRVNDFEILLEVGRTLNLSHAGVSLLYSAPHIHQRVRAIERVLGLQLFVREGRGLALTAAGKALLAEVQEAVDSVHRVEELARDLRTDEHESVVIGAAYPAIEMLPGLIARLTELDSDVRIHLEVVDTTSAPEILRRVAAEAIDIGFVGEPQVAAEDEAAQHLLYTQWRNYDAIIAVAAGRFDRFLCEMELHRRVPLLAVAGSPNASRVIRAWRDQGIGVQLTEIGRLRSTATYEALKQSALAGQGVAILPLPSVEHELRMGSMRLFPSPVGPMPYTLYMVTRPGSQPTAVERVFRFFESAKAEALTSLRAIASGGRDTAWDE